MRSDLTFEEGKIGDVQHIHLKEGDDMFDAFVGT